MNADANEHRVEELFAQAKDLPADKQIRFLDAACKNDSVEVRQAVERLLVADQREAIRGQWAEPRPAVAAVRLNCPHCHNAIELVADRLEDVVCPSCGSSFRLDAGNTQTWSQDKLPRLGKFDLLTRVGVGAFGTVYKAYDSELKRTVAVKIPRSGTLAGTEEEDRFLREGRNAAQLRHGGIVPVFEVGRSGSFPYIVSELVDGVTLADVLTAKRFSFRESAELIAKVAEALDYSHQQGVVHRDVKPSNIMLSADGTPRVMDFGLAKREAGEITMTIDGQVLGTPAYMSPEQASGKAHEVDGRSDVYSLGVILHELLTGELPFRGNQRMLMHQVMHDEPRAPRSLNDRIPRDLETICLKAMAKDPERRYAKAKDLAADLKRYLAGQPIVARPVGRMERSWRWCKRNPVVAGLLAAVVFTLAAGTVVSTVFAVRAGEREEEAIAEWERAEVEKSRADKKAAEALVQKTRADGEKTRANNKSAEAIQQKDRAEKELSRAEWLLYASQTARAQREWETNNVQLAWEHLAACRSDFRGWEYDYLYRLFTQNQPPLIQRTSAVTSVAFSPDGKRIVSGSYDGTIKVWDASSGQEKLTLKGHEESVTSVAFNADGKHIVSGSADETLKVWDAHSGQEMLIIKGHSGSVTSVAFSPDGKRIVSGSYDGTVKVWEASSGQEKLTLEGNGELVKSVAFSPDGKRIVSGSYDRTVNVCDSTSGQEMLILKGHGDGVTSVAFSPDGKRIVSGSYDRTLKIWDANSGRETLTLKGHNGSVTSVAFSPDGKRIVSGSDDSTLKVWDAISGQEAVTFKGHGYSVMSVAFNPVGKQIVSGSYNGTLHIWEADSGQKTLTLKGHRFWVRCVAFSPDGKRIVSGSYDRTLKIWDATSGQELFTLKGNNFPVTSVAFSPDGTRIVSGSDDATLKVWDATSGQERPARPVAKLKVFADRGRLWETKGGELLTLKGHNGGVTSVAFSPDGTRIVSGSKDATLKVWDATSGQETFTLKGHSGSVTSVAFSPDGKRIVSGSDESTLKVWDATSGQETFTLKGHSGSVTSVAFSPDGKRIVSGSYDHTLKVWDARSGEETLMLKGHNSWVASVAFSPDGKRIVSGSYDHTLKVWDATSGQETLTLKGHNSPVASVAFSPDGTQIVSGSADETLKIWDGSRKVPIDSPL